MRCSSPGEVPGGARYDRPMTGTPEAARAARGERRRARTRAAILDAAEGVFGAEGVRGARVEAIAEAADLSVGTIYLHFGGRHDVLMGLVERSLTVFEAYMERTADPALTPLQRVLVGGDAYLRFHLEHPGAFELLAAGTLREAETADTDVVERVQDRVNALLESFAGLVDAAVAAGEARPVDARHLTRFLWGSWNGVIALQRQLPGLRPTDDEIAATLETGRWLLREALAGDGLRDERGHVGDRVPMPVVVSRTDAED